MAAADVQLGLDQTGSQVLSSTHWGDYCSDDGLCSDATSGNPLPMANWQSLYAKRSGFTGSSHQVQADVGCFAMQQQQSANAAADMLGKHQQGVSSTSPATPGGLAVPPARYLKLSCDPLAGSTAGLLNKGPKTVFPAFAVGAANGAVKEAGLGRNSRRQLQQWLARHEVSAITKSYAGAASNSSSGTADAAHEELPGPAFALAHALPPPAFLILGVLG